MTLETEQDELDCHKDYFNQTEEELVSHSLMAEQSKG